MIAIGNQAGQVALLTANYEPKSDQYSFEANAVLPTELQDRKKQKPKHYPLLGMALGPVQGQMSKAYSPSKETLEPNASSLQDSERRYRLLLIYLDLTVLSYEISRSNNSSEVLVL